jgi:hypothetical protein
MDRRYKKRAWIGVAAWALSPLAAMVLLVVLSAILDLGHENGPLIGVLVAVTFLGAFYATFFWGGRQLTKAKGYSNAILLPGILGPPVQLIILGLLLFALPDKCADPSQPMHRRRNHRHEPLLERTIRYRRNSFIWNVFGLAGIIVALLLCVLPIPVAQTTDGRHVIALFLFVPSYASVIFGCSYWVKAKSWPDAVLLIGLLPLAILFVPYVRLIYRVVPMLLPIGMVFMPVIMIGVIAVLPDKSGLPKRKHADR